MTTDRRRQKGIYYKGGLGRGDDDESELTIGVRELKIAWASDATQWKIGDTSAEAIKVMWLEVKATQRGAIPGNRYKIGFNVSLKPEAFGWDECSVFLMVKIGSSESYRWKKVDMPKEGQQPLEYEIDVPNTADTTLHFGLYEVWAGRWKGGLSIHGAFVKKVQ